MVDMIIAVRMLVRKITLVIHINSFNGAIYRDKCPLIILCASHKIYEFQVSFCNEVVMSYLIVSFISRSLCEAEKMISIASQVNAKCASIINPYYALQASASQ